MIARSPAWESLRSKLDEAVKTDPSLTWIRERIVDPIELLRLMDREAQPSLEEDTKAQERLSILIHAALPYASLVAAINRTLTRLDDAELDAPTLLDHGELIFLAIAAARVAPPRRNAAQGFVRVVHGLALAAAGAEALWRLNPSDAASLPALLRSFDLGASSEPSHAKRYRALFALDQAEIARRKCLGRLLGSPPWLLLFDPDQIWSAADGERIAAVERRDDTTLAITIDDPPDEPVELIAGERGDVHLIEGNTEDEELRATIPEGLAGWVALVDPARAKHANDLRAQLREILTKYDGEPCLAGATIPEIPALSSPPPPPGHGNNRIPPGLPKIIEAEIDPAVVRPTAQYLLRWRSAYTKTVIVEERGIVERHPAQGELTRKAPDQPGEYSIELTPVAERAGLAVTIHFRVSRPPRLIDATHPQGAFEHRPLPVEVRLDPGTGDEALEVMISAGEFEQRAPVAEETIRFTIPAEEVVNGLRYDVVLLENEEPIGRLERGPLELRKLQPLSLVVIVPKSAEADTDSPPLDEIEQQLTAAAQEQGIDLTILELPWIEDALAVLPGFPENADDPGIQRLLERMERRALLTSGGEDALWLMAVPSEARIDRIKPASAALAVAVASQTGFSRVFADAIKKKNDLRPPSRSLRLLATIEDRTVRIEHSLVEVRPSRSADSPSELVAVMFDAAGRVLETVPLRALRPKERIVQIAALIPLGDAVQAVELRWRTRDRATVHHLAPGRGLRLSARLDPESPAGESHVVFNAMEARGGSVTVYKTASRGELETLVESVDRCPGEAVFVHSHFRADHLGLLATDGWLVERVKFPRPDEDTPLVKLRRLDGDRYFLDAPANWDVSWRIGGREGFKARSLTLRDRSAPLEVEARRAGAPPLIERLPPRAPR